MSVCQDGRRSVVPGRRSVASVLAFVLIFLGAIWSAAQSGTEVYQAEADFSLVQGHRGWSYRDSSGAALTADAAAQVWRGASPVMLWASGGNPGNAIDSVRRWTAPQDGTAQITGTARDLDAGGGFNPTITLSPHIGFVTELVAQLPNFTPVGLAFAPDGRIFIWQRTGIVRIVQGGTLLPTPFIDIQSSVNHAGDRGLLGLALDPDFSNNGFVYLLYTHEDGTNPVDPGPKTSRLTRVTADPVNPNQALPGSEIVILGTIGTPPCSAYPAGSDCIPDDAPFHTIGTVRFVLDGTLLVGNGDGSDWVAPDAQALRAQALNSYSGKILRIKPDGTAPTDNPFYNGDPNAIQSKVWVYGLRNPYRFTVDPDGGEIYIGDVGWFTWEEINRGPAGTNFGWPCYEGDNSGSAPQPGYQAAFAQCRSLAAGAVTRPLYSYGRTQGATVIGGTFYTGTAYPQQYRGNLFFADYVAEWIRRIVFAPDKSVVSIEPFATGLGSGGGGPVDLQMGPDGFLYYILIAQGEVRRIRYGGTLAVASADKTFGYAPLSVQFVGSGSSGPGGSALASYLWEFGDGATSSSPDPAHQYNPSVVTTYTARLTVTDSTGGIDSATLQVTVVPPAGAGETIYGITPGNVLIRFDSATPNVIAASAAVTGLGANETIRGIDFRPRTGQLFAVTVTTGSAANSVLRSYVINPLTAQATLVGATAAALAGAADVPSGVDFNPTVDRIRYVNTNDENARLNPNNGAVAGNDTDLTPALSVGIIAEAYDRNFDRQIIAAPANNAILTTLYVINRDTSMLGLQGGINGTGPGGPNGGAITNVGGLGFTLNAFNGGGFDIVPGTGPQRAFAALTDSADNLTRLYTINLGTGAATSVGLIGNGATQVFGIAVAPRSIKVVGADAGGGPHVRVFDGATGAEKFSFFPYPAGFTGGVRVAAGDVTGDGVADIITGAGPGGGPHVRVFDGVTGAPVPGPIGSFFAFAPAFTGGVFVAAGDLNADGFDDVIVGADAGGGPHVRVFDGVTGAELLNFFPYPIGFTGGVRVAAGDFDLDGVSEIVTAAGPGGGPHIRVLDGAGNPFTSGSLPSFVNSFFAYAPAFTGGVYVATGDVNRDGRPDIITGAGAGGGPHVRVFSGTNGTELTGFFAYVAGFTGGVRVGSADVNADGRVEILTGAGPGGGPHVRSLDGLTGADLGGFFAFTPAFTGGVFVGGTRQ